MKILPLPKIHIGAQSVDMLVPSLDRVSAERVLVITDPGIVDAGIYDEIKDILVEAGRGIVLFDRVEPDPSIRIVEEVVEIARSGRVEAVIARNDNMVAVNSSISIDLLGQASSESIGSRQFSGVGGQVDFIRGAVAAKGGRSIVAPEFRESLEVECRDLYGWM